jgi:AraC-like DNA-binding protein
MLCVDLANPLTLPALPDAQGEAPRSFQRGLGRAGLSYTQLLGEARCRSAAWWLMRTAAPAAEVGYVCGYADQPHFTRDFRHRVGMTPLRYRAEFAVPG